MVTGWVKKMSRERENSLNDGGPQSRAALRCPLVSGRLPTEPKTGHSETSVLREKGRTLEGRASHPRLQDWRLLSYAQVDQQGWTGACALQPLLRCLTVISPLRTKRSLLFPRIEFSSPPPW